MGQDEACQEPSRRSGEVHWTSAIHQDGRRVENMNLKTAQSMDLELGKNLDPSSV